MIDFLSLPQLVSKNRAFFIYFGKKLDANCVQIKQLLEASFGQKVSLSFSLKTQPNFKIVDTVLKNGLSIDVSSLNELNYALDFKFPVQKIFLGGIGLTNQAIEKALDRQIGGIHLNSIEVYEYAREQKTIRKANTDLTIRFHPEYLKGVKIGETFERILASFKNKNVLNGVHVYVGRESFEPKMVMQIFNDIQSLESEGVFAKDWTLYLGPGLPDLEQSPISPFDARCGFSRIKVELGRSLVSSCGYYGAQVMSVKQFSLEKKTVIIDGGFQHFGSPWLNLRKGPVQMKTIFCSSDGVVKSSPLEAAAIYGGLCLWHDCLHPGFDVPSDLKRGDWMIVPHMGAYGLTAGVPLFIGETLPLEYYFDGSICIDVTHKNFGQVAKE